MLSFIIFTTILFAIGCVGMFFVKQHLLTILLSLEIVLLAVTINFVVFSVFYDDTIGQVFALLVLSVAAAETALGLAILVVYYRLRGGIAVDLIQLLKS